jgi:pimeloyl-ACP methyl ester carboxylesterase
MPETLVLDHPVAKANIAYWDQGTAVEETILFLHGNLGSKRWWEPQFDILPAEMRLVAPDFPGCGQTASRNEDLSVPAQVRFLSDFVSTLDLDGLAVVAHSTSCATALDFCMFHPHLVNSLVLCGCPPLTGVKSPPELYRHLQAARRDRSIMSTILAYLMPHLDLDVASNREWFANLVEDATMMDGRSVDGLTRALEAWSAHERIGQLQVPLLLVRGQDDEVVPHHQALTILRSTTLANNLEVIRGAGHSPMIENPEAFAIRLIDFVAQDFGAFENLPLNQTGTLS